MINLNVSMFLINNALVKPDGYYASFEKYSKKTLLETIDGNLGYVVLHVEARKIFLEQNMV